MKDNEDIKKAVRERYGAYAETSSSCCGPKSSCCGGTKINDEINSAPGYTKEQMSSVPDGANLGLGCGNPVVIASLKPGETVLDLGSGAGFDCFLAANKVGDSGRVIGVDMTPEMLTKARRNAISGGYKNVEFRLGEIENLPVSDNNVDVVISNCVINLAPGKARVFAEVFRVLKPGGRFMISDIVLTAPLPEFIRESVQAYVGCISGALLKNNYLDIIKNTGFANIEVLSEKIFPIDDLLQTPEAKVILGNSGADAKEIAKLVESITVYAKKQI